MYWLEVSVVTDGEGAEAVAEVLRPYAYNDGVVLEQWGDESDPDPDALETAVTVKIYLPEEEDTPAIRRRIEETIYHMGRMYPLPEPIFRPLEEKDWAAAWKENYQPFRVGQHLWIQPSWVPLPEMNEVEANGLKPDDIVLVLDPGMAFGTGTHPTTQMCLQALEELVWPGADLLDVGTGSGILAIAAAKLGAGHLLGVDTDAQAVKTAVANAVQNDVPQIEIRQGSLVDVARQGWDVVVVNILARVIIPLLESGHLLDYVAENGKLVLSGIIAEQREEVETAVANAGGKIAKTLAMGDWLAFIVTPRSDRK